MPRNDPTFIEGQIDWKFLVERRENRVRYGTFGGQFYKQFLPGGIVLSVPHVPRKIPKVLYEIAKKRSIE